MVLVRDEVDELLIGWGMGTDDVAAGSGESKDPDIPHSPK